MVSQDTEGEQSSMNQFKVGFAVAAGVIVAIFVFSLVTKMIA
jgi:hypothetical protein